ncbi:MAG TPA: hypothetical protein VIK89_03155 [Cytophagaceae bacterium]
MKDHSLNDKGLLADSEAEWTSFEKFAFRVAFGFFGFLTIPIWNINYIKNWFNINWSNLHIRDMNSLGGFGVRWVQIDSESGIWGLLSYINWAIVLAGALVVAIIWTLLDKKSKHYRELYYLVNVTSRFTIIAQLNGLVFSKVFPSQMPPLSLGQLNTNLGDFTAQKLYWIQLSFVPGYEIFLGAAELVIMILLFFRKTAALGGLLSLIMIGNIAIANHVYDGGVHVLATFHALLGLFIVWPYLPSVWNLLVKGKDITTRVYYYPMNEGWKKYTRLSLKTFAFVVFFIGSAYLHWHNYTYDSYKVPARPGLANARGFYQVTEFRLNGKELPYSPVDSIRWQEAAFEKWSTLSYKVHRKFEIHGEAGRGKQFADVDRTYESAGTGGGKRYYYYEADTINQTLTLKNKNKLYKDEHIVLKYERPTDTRIILSGLNEFKDSIYVVLDKIDKKYPLYEGRQQSIGYLNHEF